MIQLSIFAISLVVENVLEKNCKLWLVLQDMHKAYNSIGWEHLRRSLVRIKMYDRFIRFFGSIYNGHINKVMTDFGLTDGYCVYNSLDQEKVFLSLLWCIFYDLLLCEVKKQEDVYGYRLNSHFVFKSGQAESQAKMTSFFAVDAFVNNTIWISSSQTTTQHILNVASEFFRFNNISINNNKTVVIPINCQVSNSYLTVSGSPIFVAKKKEPYHYLGIFLSFEGLSKPSLAKTHSDVWFFVNLVLRKVISDKQFVYLVSVVFFPIVSYRTQFSFVSISAKSKSAFFVSFANLLGILGWLFFYRSHDLQVFSWCPYYFLQFLVCVKVNSLDNFLAGMGSISMFFVLGKPNYFKYVSSLWYYRIIFMDQLHDKHGALSVHFFGGEASLSACSPLLNISFDIFWSYNFGVIRVNLLHVNTVHLSVYMDISLSSLRISGMMTGAAVFFEDIDLGLGIGVFGLVFSTIVKLQAIVLALECIPSFHFVNLFSDSQAALDVFKSKSVLAHLDFRNWCWVEHHHIANIKIKDYSGVSNNEHANAFARAAAFFDRHLPHMVSEYFFQADGMTVFGNFWHFVCDIFQSIHCAYWKIGSGSHILIDSLCANINWSRSLLVWHSDSHLAAGFTSACTANFCLYLMKALHYRFLVTCYSSVMCLFYGDVEVSDHVFSCPFDTVGHAQLIEVYVSAWETHLSLSHFSFCVLQLLYTCVFNVVVGTALYKDFVFNDWYHEFVSIFKNPKVAAQNIVFFVHKFCFDFQDNIWLVYAKHWAIIEKDGLILQDGSVSVSVSGLLVVLSAGVIRLLSIADAFGISFRFCKSCLFFLGIEDMVSVHIGV
ncbi:hypothetical protein G9A89_021309 [Geosiphon pyriformis]|nr:hypothetical protein G9A89_021309 [Geosiphon pyriformis]